MVSLWSVTTEVDIRINSETSIRCMAKYHHILRGRRNKIVGIIRLSEAVWHFRERRKGGYKVWYQARLIGSQFYG